MAEAAKKLSDFEGLEVRAREDLAQRLADHHAAEPEAIEDALARYEAEQESGK